MNCRDYVWCPTGSRWPAPIPLDEILDVSLVTIEVASSASGNDTHGNGLS